MREPQPGEVGWPTEEQIARQKQYAAEIKAELQRKYGTEERMPNYGSEKSSGAGLAGFAVLVLLSPVIIGALWMLLPAAFHFGEEMAAAPFIAYYDARDKAKCEKNGDIWRPAGDGHYSYCDTRRREAVEACIDNYVKLYPQEKRSLMALICRNEPTYRPIPPIQRSTKEEEWNDLFQKCVSGNVSKEQFQECQRKFGYAAEHEADEREARQKAVCKEWEDKHPVGSPIDVLHGYSDDGLTNLEGARFGAPVGCAGPLEDAYKKKLNSTGGY